MEETSWDMIFNLFRRTLTYLGAGLPSVSEIAAERPDPFQVLISTIISLRTRDEVTLAASRRLFALAKDPCTMRSLSLESIQQAIHPAGFYRTKAASILKICDILLTKYDGKVPADKEALLALPGVGVKTANLTLNLGFGIDAICVDTHVHRIANRCGWIATSSPEASEKALELVMPKRYWIPLNELLVSYGQRVCTPISPRCSICPIDQTCAKVGVTTSR